MKLIFLRIFIISILTVVFTASFSQSAVKVDSLKSLLPTADDSLKIEIYNQLSWELRNSEIHESIKFGLESIELSQKRKDYKNLTKAYSFTGVAYRNLGNYTEALDFYYKGLKLAKSQNLSEQIGFAYINIGNLYIYQELYKDAEIYLNIALKLSDSLNNLSMQAYCYLNLARVDIYLENYNNALSNLEKSLKLRENSMNINEQAVCYKYRGDVFAAQNNYDLALNNYFESLKLSENSKDIDLFANIYNHIAQIYIKKTDYNSAELYAEKSLISSESINSKLRIRNAYTSLMNISKYRKDYIKASEYADLILLYNDSLHNSQINEKISYIKFIDKQHEYEQKLKDQLFEYKLEVNKQRQSRDILFILAVVFIIISAILFIFFRNKRKVNTVLSLKNDKLKESKSEIEKFHRDISDSIDYATRIQTSILPNENVLNEVFSDHFIIFKPRDRVSGDFYWWTKLNEFAVISAADCTGHGVPGAFMSMLGISFLREIVNKEKITNTATILKSLRNEVINTLKDNLQEGMDIALITLNTEKKTLQFSGANNPLYLIRKGSLETNSVINEIEIENNSSEYHLYEFTPDLMPISNYIKMDTFKNTEIKYQKGDFLYMFSDGYTDQLGGKNNKKFKFNKFRKLLIENVENPSAIQKEILNETFESWKGKNKQLDDIVILGMKI